MDEEKIIEQNFGKKRPFKVPQGYFETFNSQLLEKLPLNEPSKVRSFSWKRPIAWAACLIAAIILTSVAIFSFNGEKLEKTSNIDDKVKITSQNPENDLMDQFSDYAMLDNDDFYSYVYDE